MTASPEHTAITQLAALYCREMWLCWAIGLEPKGVGRFNYDVVAIRGKPRAGVVVIETKVHRSDFLAGLKRGQFNESPYVHEIWLAYNGDFSIDELPEHCGILELRPHPVCPAHALFFGRKCPDGCKNTKTIYFDYKRKAKRLHKGEGSRKIWKEYVDKWIWHIATKGATDNINRIAANAYQTGGQDAGTAN